VKLEQLQSYLNQKRIDACILLGKDPNLYYFVQQQVIDGFLVVPKKGKPVLAVNVLEEKVSGIKTIKSKNFEQDIRTVLKKYKTKRVGVNRSFLTVKQQCFLKKHAKLVDIEDFLNQLRATKTKKEIRLIKKSCWLASKIMNNLLDNFDKLDFKKENDIKTFLKIEALKNNAETSFEPIVASGKNAGIPHHKKDSRLKKGFCIIDFGVKLNGYCSDITRTIYLGKPSWQELTLYKHVLRVQQDAIKMVKPGIKAASLDKEARKQLGRNQKYFVHGLGHGLGLKIHELPNISQKSKDILKEGMVLTIEPGIYNKFGIRIEDDLLVTKNGCRVLTTCPKELRIFDA
jgi:Xaa-Pro aminopeptidase